MSGPLRLVPPAEPGTADAPELLPLRPAHPRGVPSRPRWARDPLDELLVDFGGLAAGAVHPDEIAAVLEADGLTGEQVQERFGRRDTFELAAELYARVPRVHPAPPPRPDPWRAVPGPFLLRGLVFASPGLGYAVGAPFLTGPPGVLGLPAGSGALTASALVGWAWNQGLAHRAHIRLASGGRAATGRCLRTGAPLGALLAFLAALSFPSSGGALAFAAGQSAYLAAATVLLVLGKERLLPPALLPTAVGATLLPGPGLPSWARAVALLTTVATVLLVAVRETVRAHSPDGGSWRRGVTAVLRGRWRATVPLGPGEDTRPRGRHRAVTPRPGPRVRPPRRAARRGPAKETTPEPVVPLTVSVPYGLFGLGCAVLTTVAAFGEMVRHGAGAALTGPVVIALTLSMGAAEWLLHRCRGRALMALARSTTLRGLRWRTRGVLSGCLSGYLIALTALVWLTHTLWPAAPPLGAVRLLAVLALGSTLWTGLLLQAFGSAWTPAVVCAAAAAAEAAAAAGEFSRPPVVQLAVCGVATAVLLTAATALLGRMTTHR
ncbi:hypothetical protein [Streptomyces cucumeris]|uniref:hypothetical protein n=1 Tax=Streptomyces cucumeris TaxID=2962890 RepID=UPI0020C8EDEC|nr:hypothetical protein [Streptomyces sp. NEAU-Y11]MCP9207576.1 hypothetical protein [Streptomyces sp. NEAU-Y11]